MYEFNSRFLGLLRKYSSGANKQGYYLAGLETLVTRDTAWMEVLPKVMAFQTYGLVFTPQQLFVITGSALLV